MLDLKTKSKVFVGIQPIDFRKGIDGIVQLCREELGGDPRSGSLFIFCNRRRTSIKILVYDIDGYFLILKRFSKGKISFWPNTSKVSSMDLQILLRQPEKE